MTRISEPYLVLPALYIIKKYPNINTSELLHELRELLHPSGEDIEILHNRADDKFSQIVRNLVSHHTLDGRLQYTTQGKDEFGQTTHKITMNGLEYLEQNEEAVNSLYNSNFGYEEKLTITRTISNAIKRRKKIILLDENPMISEGDQIESLNSTRYRSQLLRKAAISFYSVNDRIRCIVCDFDFFAFYGPLGNGYIEIHHLKPISQYEDDDLSKSLRSAIENTVPVCANCHRMLHRSKSGIISIDDLKSKMIK